LAPYRTFSQFANFFLLAEANRKPEFGGVKSKGITGLFSEVTWSEDFRERVVLMPCIRSDFAARLAADLRARGANLFYGHSDFGSPPGHIEIDTRQLEGLRTFYRRAAAENHRIDLCIHYLTRQPLIDSAERFENRLDARTVFIGTLLPAQYLSTKEGIGTILNLALLDTGDSTKRGAGRTSSGSGVRCNALCCRDRSAKDSRICSCAGVGSSAPRRAL